VSGVQHGARAGLEVLHDVRARSRVPVRQTHAGIALLGVLAACGDAPRETPADTALAPPSASDTSRSDTGVRITGHIVDTGTGSAPVRGVSLVLVADSASGDYIFNRRGTCFTCHGQNGAGMSNLGPDLRDATWLHGDGSFRSILRVINEGVAVPKASPIGMPSFEGRLPEAERYQVAAYVFSLSHPGSVVVDTTAADTLSPFTLPPSANPPR
jgi:Cytochrome C oxidase, cbb3-type, subunit III